MNNRERFWQFVRFQKVDHLPFWADWLGPWQRWRDEHLNPHAPGRYPEDAQWEAMKLEWQNHAEVISIDGGSFYGFLHDWIGFENLSLNFAHLQPNSRELDDQKMSRTG